MGLLSDQRKAFFSSLCEELITVTNGVVSFADSSSPASRAISFALAAKVGQPKNVAKKMNGQRAGALFETACRAFISESFACLNHLRPGKFDVLPGAPISRFDQYAHLNDIETLASASRELRTAIGSDYLIKPDITIIRHPTEDATINTESEFVDEHVAIYSPLRSANRSLPSLHASISCKWTIRSDRAQNSRSEALNLIRNRKGRLPHIAVVTAEPTPNRLASLALGTGDIDCVYHFALPELREALVEQHREESLELLDMMIDGKRLRDISDLPLDLVV